LEWDLGLEHGVSSWVNREWCSFTLFAQVVIGAIRVQAFVTRAVDVRVTPIAYYVRVSNTVRVVLCVGDVVGRLSEFGKGVTGVSILNGRAADIAAIPIGTIQALPPSTDDALGAEVTSGRVSSGFVETVCG
jgi:hypothetical protein